MSILSYPVLAVVLLFGSVVQQAPAGIPAAARNIPFEINSDKIYVQARLNGQGPFWLMLDTGSGGMVLDTATARRLGLPLGQSGDTVGAGEGSFTLTEVLSTVDVDLPGVTLQKQPAAVGPLDRARAASGDAAAAPGRLDGFR